MSDEHDKSLVSVPRADVSHMHPLVQIALAHSPDPATLRELLAVQRDWEAGEARKAYTRAMVELKRDLPTVLGRDQLVDYTGKTGIRTRFTHTSLAAAMDAITEPLTMHGFSLAWIPNTGQQVTVTCRLTHAEGHFEEATISAPPDASGGKGPAHAVASAITLLSRYTALALLGIATADQRDPSPAAPPAPDGLDPAKNLRAAAWLRRRGISRDHAEEHVGRTVSEWTTQDLEALKAMAMAGDEIDPETGEIVPPARLAP